MARFEISTSNGEKILFDHAAAGMVEFLEELNSNAFILGDEVRGAVTGAAQALIMATGQVILVRPMDNLSTQSSTFRPKR